MLKRLATALLAATALLPATAFAQDVTGETHIRSPRALRSDDAPRPPRDAGPRGGDRGLPGGAWQQRPDRGTANPGGWQQRPDRGNLNPGGWQQRPDRGNANPGNWQQRPDRNPDLPNGWAQRPSRSPGQAGNWQQRPDRQADWRGRRDNDADNLRRRRDWIARSGRGQSWSNWNDHYRDRAGFYDRRDWSQGRGWYGDRNQGWGWNQGNGGWNRDWRHDRRYDWNAYRASNRSLYRLPRYYAPYGWNYGYRRYSAGVTLDSLLFAQSYWIDDPWSYRLPPADGPYRWVRYYNDALLVDVDTGEVVDTIYDIFW